MIFVDPRLLHLHVQAAKLQWSLDEKLGSSGGTGVRPSLCLCVFMLLCSTAQWFDFVQH